MTNRQFAALLLKLIALYFLVVSATNLMNVFFYQSPMDESIPEMVNIKIMLLVQPLTLFLSSVFIAILSDILARKLFPDEKELQFPNMSAKDLQAVLFATVGAYLLCSHIANFAQVYQNFRQSQIPSLGYTFEPIQNLIIALPPILGFILLIYSMKFATILQKLRQRNPNAEV